MRFKERCAETRGRIIIQELVSVAILSFFLLVIGMWLHVPALISSSGNIPLNPAISTLLFLILVLSLAALISLILKWASPLALLRGTHYTTSMETLTDEQLRAAVPCIQEPFIVLNPHGDIMFWSPEAKELFQYSSEESRGKAFHHLCLIESDSNTFATFLHTPPQNMNDPSSPSTLELTAKRQDGSHFPVDVSLRSSDISGTPCFFLTVRDITSKKECEENLQEREHHYRTLVEGAQQPIFSIDSKGKYLFLNEYAARTLGGKPQDFIGKTLWDVFPEYIADDHMKTILHALEKGHKVAPERKSIIQGEIRWYEASIQKLSDIPGEDTVALVILMDTTERHRVQETLRDTEEIYKSLIKTSPDAVVVMDMDVRVIYISERAKELFRVTDPEKHMGRSAFEFIAAKDRDKARHNLQSAFKSGFSERTEYTIRRTDGTSFIGELSSALIRDIEGKPRALMTNIRDITARKKAEAALQYRIKMEQLISLLSTHFIQIPSHRIDTGINLALRALGKFTRMGRTYLFQFSADGSTYSNTHEWCAEGVESVRSKYQEIPVENMPWLISRIKQGEIVHISRVADMPPEAEKEKDEFMAEGIKSLVNVPLVYGETVIGFSGFACIAGEKNWTDEDTRLLRMSGEIFVNALVRKRTEGQLLESEERTRAIINAIPDMLFTLDGDGRYKEFIASKDEAPAIPAESFLGKTIPEMMPQNLANLFMSYIKKALRTKESQVFEYQIHSPLPNGPLLDYEARFVVTGENEVLSMVRNITIQKRFKEQRLQSQKMEAIGNLAGGIAHDFNNLLTVITGYGEILLHQTDVPEATRKNINEILKAAHRASSLTKQLLAFSRKQMLNQVVLNLNNLIYDMEEMLSRLIGEDIEVTTNYDSNLKPVKADKGQMEQVLMNLVLNSRDAMPHGGTITLTTTNVTLKEYDLALNPLAHSGDYVCLAVSDTGEGIEEKMIQHIFEPFFTTKEKGKGTGLGLPVVYGIVRQHDGWIDVDTKPGEGATFRIYIPAFTTLMPEFDQPSPPNLERVDGKGKKILVVEDDPDFRFLLVRALTDSGYRVIEADSAERAREIFDSERGNFDMVFSDVVLPGKSGVELIEDIRSLHPDIPVLLSSGYPDKKAQWSLIQNRGYPFLAKPYTINDLFQHIKKSLS